MEEWKALTLWCPHVHQIQPKDTVPRKLKEGLHKGASLLCRMFYTRFYMTRALREWEDGPAINSPSQADMYTSTIRNIKAPPELNSTHGAKQSVYMQQNESPFIWEFELPGNLITKEWRSQFPTKTLVHAYQVLNGTLQKISTVEIPSLESQLWENTWISYRAAKENCFFWQVLYRVLATQRWRQPQLPPFDPGHALDMPYTWWRTSLIVFGVALSPTQSELGWKPGRPSQHGCL
ncbi:unnamed protein product [Calypogeia fissa]